MSANLDEISTALMWNKSTRRKAYFTLLCNISHSKSISQIRKDLFRLYWWSPLSLASSAAPHKGRLGCAVTNTPLIPDAEKKQADCPFEGCRRMCILQIPKRGKMRRLFSASAHSNVFIGQFIYVLFARYCRKYKRQTTHSSEKHQ